jgi:hypothetical protein
MGQSSFAATAATLAAVGARVARGDLLTSVASGPVSDLAAGGQVRIVGTIAGEATAAALAVIAIGEPSTRRAGGGQTSPAPSAPNQTAEVRLP